MGRAKFLLDRAFEHLTEAFSGNATDRRARDWFGTVDAGHSVVAFQDGRWSAQHGIEDGQPVVRLRCRGGVVAQRITGHGNPASPELALLNQPGGSIVLLAGAWLTPGRARAQNVYRFMAKARAWIEDTYPVIRAAGSLDRFNDDTSSMRLTLWWWQEFSDLERAALVRDALLNWQAKQRARSEATP